MKLNELRLQDFSCANALLTKGRTLIRPMVDNKGVDVKKAVIAYHSREFINRCLRGWQSKVARLADQYKTESIDWQGFCAALVTTWSSHDHLDRAVLLSFLRPALTPQPHSEPNPPVRPSLQTLDNVLTALWAIPDTILKNYLTWGPVVQSFQSGSLTLRDSDKLNFYLTGFCRRSLSGLLARIDLDLEDFLQKVWTKFFSSIGNYNYLSALPTYLCSIARRYAFELKRNYDRSKKGVLAGGRVSPDANIDYYKTGDARWINQAISPDFAIHCADLYRQCKKGLSGSRRDRRSARLRRIIAIMRLEGYTYEQIQTLTGIPKNSIGTYLRRHLEYGEMYELITEKLAADAYPLELLKLPAPELVTAIETEFYAWRNDHGTSALLSKLVV